MQSQFDFHNKIFLHLDIITDTRDTRMPRRENTSNSIIPIIYSEGLFFCIQKLGFSHMQVSQTQQTLGNLNFSRQSSTFDDLLTQAVR